MRKSKEVPKIIVLAINYEKLALKALVNKLTVSKRLKYKLVLVLMIQPNMTISGVTNRAIWMLLPRAMLMRDPSCSWQQQSHP